MMPGISYRIDNRKLTLFINSQQELLFYITKAIEYQLGLLARRIDAFQGDLPSGWFDHDLWPDPIAAAMR